MEVAGPLYTWALLVKDTRVPDDALDQAFMQQRRRLGHAPKHTGVAGPAGAGPAALRTLNWRAFSAASWVTGAGIALDLAVGSPDWTSTLARRDFINVRFEEWSRQKDYAPEGPPADRRLCGYWMAPLCGYSRQGRMPESGTLRRMFEQRLEARS